MTGDISDVLNQADALMRRHRSFSAHSPVPPPGPTAAEEDDIPLLTEIVATGELTPPDLDALRDDLKHTLAAVLSDWLAEMLPAAAANASQQILAELDAKARSTLLPRLTEIIETQRAKLGR